MSSIANTSSGKVLKRANPSTIQDKFMVGYQGWFTCAGDGKPIGSGHHGWLHWFNYPIPDGGRPNTDLWPDVSEYSSSELYPAPGLYFASGEQAKLFSSRHPKTVQRHFNWMAQHGVDGAFLQRFAGQCDLEGGNEGIRNQRDEIGDRVREAAEKEGRVFAIMYDVSGVAPDRIQRVLEQDWIHLLRDKGVLNSPNYLKEKGKPVISLWGFGFDNANHTPSIVRAITSFFRSATPGGAYIIAGTPAHWRTSESDADRNPEFVDVWLNEFDAISPWTVGRYGNEGDADRFAEEKIKPDIELLKKRAEEGHKKIDYIPVVLPGGSGYNLSEGKWGFNDIKRNGGTAFMPVVQTRRQVPVSDKFRFMGLDEDGHDLPSDWYMRICGFAAEGLRSERMIHETFPSKELQDYWSTRPHYEDETKASGSGSGGGSGSGEGQAYQDWLKTQKEDKDELPPPPYSLEATEPEPEAAAQPARTETILPSPAVRTSSPVPIQPVIPQATSAVVQDPSRASQGQSPMAQGQLPTTTHSSSNVGPAAIPPTIFPAPASVSLTSAPSTVVHSVSINALAENFIRQSSLTAGHPAYPPQPSLPAGLMGTYNPSTPAAPPVPTSPMTAAGGGYPHPGASQPFGGMPTVQSPLAQSTSSYGFGSGPQAPISRPGEGGGFPNVSQPQPLHHSYMPSPASSQQPLPHQKYSHESPPPSLPQRPGQQPQQNSYGPPPPQRPAQPNQQYSYGPSPVSQMQWPPANWNDGPHPYSASQPSHPQPYPHPGGFKPSLGTNTSQFNAVQQPSQSPTPSFHVPLRPPSIPPRPHEGVPDNRPLGGSSPKPQQQGPSFPIASGALDFAFNAVGSVAGDERRRQLESGVGKLAQTGSKLYHKFSK